MTPLYACVGKKLIGSLRNETTVRNSAARATFPVHPPSVREVIARALQEEDREMAETRWSDGVSSSGEAPRWGGRRFGPRLVDRQQVVVQAEPARAFAPIQRIGDGRVGTSRLGSGICGASSICSRAGSGCGGDAGTRWS